MNAAAERLTLWFADISFLSSILLVVVLVALRILEQPVRRVIVAKSAIIALLLLATLVALPGWSVVHLWSRPKPLAAISTPNRSLRIDNRFTIQSDPASAALQSHDAPSSSDSTQDSFWPRRLPTFSQSIALSYASGVACVFAWLCVGMIAARRLVRDSQSAPEPILHLAAELAPRSDTALRISPRIPVPVALGIRGPTIILPSGWIHDGTNIDSPPSQGGARGGLSPDELRTILAHELAHIQNGDLCWL
ncbi:MAG TPA: hypothetical protein VGM76_04750, partial [Lacipirellulaceae bacterium]